MSELVILEIREISDEELFLYFFNIYINNT